MPTVVNKVVKYSGGDYTSIPAALAAVPANLVTADQQWNILIDESAAGVYEWDLGNYGVTISGITTDATRYIRIAPNTGKGFKDNVSKITNALRYNAANGIALKTTGIRVFEVGVGSMVFEGLQMYAPNVFNSFNGLLTCLGGGAGATVKDCILQSARTDTARAVAGMVGGSVINSLIITSGAHGIALSGAGTARNVTVVNVGSAGTSVAIYSDFSASTIKNTAAFGFSAVLGGGITSLDAASSNNATDLGSGPTNWGTGSLVSRTYANQFQSITGGSEDFRVKAGADLINAGTPDATYTSNLDIVGSARSLTTPTIGAWEFPSITYTYARPSSDVTTQWTPSTAGPHYALINETTPNDANYIYATAAAQTDEVGLQAMSTPTAGTDVLVNYRVQGITGGGSVTVSLYTGATLVKADTTRTANNTSPAYYTMTVTAAEWGAVAVNWSNMRLRFVSA